MADPDYAALEAAYLEAIHGSRMPSGVTASGTALNRFAEKHGLQESYDPSLTYFFDASGIYIVRDYGLEPLSQSS